MLENFKKLKIIIMMERTFGLAISHIAVTTIITARKRSLGQGNMFTGVCLSTGGGVPDQVHPRTRCPPGDQVHPTGPGTPPGQGTPPGTNTPPGPGIPQGQHPPDQVHPPGPGTPPMQSMLGDTVNERAVRILLECNLVPR